MSSSAAAAGVAVGTRGAIAAAAAGGGLRGAAAATTVATPAVQTGPGPASLPGSTDSCLQSRAVAHDRSGQGTARGGCSTGPGCYVASELQQQGGWAGGRAPPGSGLGTLLFADAGSRSPGQGPPGTSAAAAARGGGGGAGRAGGGYIIHAPNDLHDDMCELVGTGEEDIGCSSLSELAAARASGCDEGEFTFDSPTKAKAELQRRLGLKVADYKGHGGSSSGQEMGQKQQQQQKRACYDQQQQRVGDHLSHDHHHHQQKKVQQEEQQQHLCYDKELAQELGVQVGQMDHNSIMLEREAEGGSLSPSGSSSRGLTNVQGEEGCSWVSPSGGSSGSSRLYMPPIPEGQELLGESSQEQEQQQCNQQQQEEEEEEGELHQQRQQWWQCRQQQQEKEQEEGSVQQQQQRQQWWQQRQQQWRQEQEDEGQQQQQQKVDDEEEQEIMGVVHTAAAGVDGLVGVTLMEKETTKPKRWKQDKLAEGGGSDKQLSSSRGLHWGINKGDFRHLAAHKQQKVLVAEPAKESAGFAQQPQQRPFAVALKQSLKEQLQKLGQKGKQTTGNRHGSDV